MIGTALGAQIWSAGVSTPVIVAVALSNGLLFAGALVFNDSHDHAEDAINKPERPIPSGRVGAAQASLVGLSLSLLGTVVAFFITPTLGMASVAVAFLSVAYTLWLKGLPLVGNAVCAALCVYPMACWTLFDAPLDLTYATIVVALLIFRLGAEILKTAEDAPGDDAAGIRTLATLGGVGFANRIGTLLLCVSLLICWSLIAKADLVYVVSVVPSTVVALAACAAAFASSRKTGAGWPFVASERAIMALMTFGLVLGMHPG